MESKSQLKKSPINKTLLAILVILLLIGALVGVYFWQNGQLKQAQVDLKTKTDQIANLEKEIKATKEGEPVGDDVAPGAPPEKPSGYIDFSEEEILKVLTIRAAGQPSGVDHWLPVVDRIVGDYAKTAPIPMDYNSEQGYHVPGMGGSTYIWHKKDGAWQKIGQCTESGCEMAEGYEYSKLPKELTH